MLSKFVSTDLGLCCCHSTLPTLCNVVWVLQQYCLEENSTENSPVVFVFVNRDVFQQGTALKPAQYQPLVRQVCPDCTSCPSVGLCPQKSRTGLSCCMFHLNFNICLLSTLFSAQRDHLDSFTAGSENVRNANYTT